MHHTPVRILLAAAVTAALLLPAAGYSQHRPRSKRVWTNDDFAAPVAAANLPTAEARPAEPDKAPAAAVGADPAGSNAEKASGEAAKGTLATARARQKAFEQTIAVFKSKMEKETDSFRADVYRKILEDTFALRENNRRVIEELSEKQNTGAKEGGAPSSQE